jgi:hypothetical protein
MFMYVPDQEMGALIDLCKFVHYVFGLAIIFDTMAHLFITIECISSQYISEAKEICVWSNQLESWISQYIYQLIHSNLNNFRKLK